MKKWVFLNDETIIKISSIVCIKQYNHIIEVVTKFAYSFKHNFETKELADAAYASMVMTLEKGEEHVKS